MKLQKIPLQKKLEECSKKDQRSDGEAGGALGDNDER